MGHECKKITVKDIIARKSGEKIVCLTAYDAAFASLLDASGIDVILVGDSLGNVILGYENTLPVTLDDMVHHTRAVARVVKRALIVGDMPFGSFQPSVEQAVKSAVALIKAGADAVKVEGGGPVLEAVSRMVSFGIPVMGHLGLTPQWVKSFGGYRIQGRGEEARRHLVQEAKALEEAGVFSVVLEGVPEETAKAVTSSVNIPTIGIGAGACCDGQVLVLHDLLGFTEKVPRFVKKYFDMASAVKESVTRFIEEVRSGTFPSEEHVYHD